MRYFRALIALYCLIPFPTLFAQPSLLLNVAGQPPLNSKNLDGFMDEVSSEALHRIGYQLSTIRLPAERALRNANAGRIDGEISRVKGLENIYNNLIRVPEKIMDWKFVVFSKKEIDLREGWNSLMNKNIAFINGWKILENNVPYTAAVTKAKNSQQLFNLLIKNRVDYIIYEQWAGEYFLKEHQLSDIQLNQPPLAIKEMFIYLHKKHKALIPLLQQALTNMKKDGSYHRLFAKHLKPKTDNNIQ